MPTYSLPEQDSLKSTQMSFKAKFSSNFCIRADG